MIPFYRIAEISLYSLLNFLPFLVLALYPFRRTLRFSTPVTAVLVACVSVFQVFLGLWAAFGSEENKGIVSMSSTLIYAVFYFIAVKAFFGKTLFTLLTISNTANLVVMVSKYLEGLFFYEYALMNYRWTYSLFMVLVQIIFLTPIWIFNRNKYTDAVEMEVGTSVWKVLWLIPATFYLIWYYHIYGGTETALEMALNSDHIVYLLFVNMGAQIVYSMIVRLINEQYKNMTLESQNHNLAMQNLQYANLRERIAEARHAKHDIRHHIAVMSGYLADKEYDKLEAYLSSYKKSLPDDSKIVFCKNYAVNALLLYFAQLAKDNRIDFAVHADIPESINVPENELSVVLGNLLENAIDACSMQTDGERKIIIGAKTDSTSVYFTVDNTYDSEIRLDKKGNYISTKQGGSGLGIKSVRSIVERSGGMFVIEQKDGMFCASVMMNASSDK